MDIAEVEHTIRKIDDDLVRAQFSLAIHRETRTKENLVRPGLISTLSSTNSIVTFNHIDLVLQQDCALAICRMMDKGTGAHSFWKLKNLCYPSKDILLNQARNQYLNPEHKSLAIQMVKDTEESINQFISQVSSLNKSKDFIAVKNLRDDTLGHALKISKGDRPNMNMIENCISRLEDILSLSYLIFLQTDYRPQSGYKFARADAEKFWKDFSTNKA